MDLSTLTEREVVASVAKWPGAFAGQSSFDHVTAFFNGYSVGQVCAGRPGLTGFREWLLTRLGRPSNLWWSGLVLQLTFPGRDAYPNRVPAHEDEEALAALFRYLDEFLGEREAADAEPRT